MPGTNNNSGSGEMETVTECRRYDDVDSLPASYNHLFSGWEELGFDLGRDWFGHLAATALEPQDSVLLYGLEGGKAGGAEALLPLRRRGRELASLSTYYSTLFLPLLKDDRSERCLAELFLCIKNAPEQWTEVRLSPMPVDHPLFDSIVGAMKATGWKPFPYFCFGNWYLPLEGRSFGAYWQGLSSRLRNTVERKRKKFFNQAGGRLEVVEGGEELEQAISAYDQVYGASWKKAEPFPDFIPGLIRLFAAKGMLRLGLAYIDDKPAAAQIWFVNHGRAAIYKLAYDERFAEYSVGSILTAHLLCHVVDVDGVDEVDYLSGDDPYKRQWMSRRRERWGVVAYNPATIQGFINMYGERSRRLVKAVLGGVRRRNAREN
jgi:hypothetical protein